LAHELVFLAPGIQEMKLLTRYLSREIYASIALVFTALILLFAFLDFIHELGTMGYGQYSLGYVVVFVILTIPGHVYELFPVAVLIGTITALVQMAARSELTIYRASGASTSQMLGALCKIALPMVLLSFICGELVSPPSERMAQKLRLKALNSQVSLQAFRSGVWVKDDLSFVNVKSVMPDTSLLDINIYTLDPDFHLKTIVRAKHASYVQPGSWRLEEVLETRFDKSGVSTKNLSSQDWQSALTPGILSVMLVVPEQMSAYDLYKYASHLKENKQQSARYEIAMWNKLIYPFALLVMMVLALPFASYQRRSGGVSVMVFMGIVLGLVFHFAGRLFASLGSLYNWQPLLSATAMTGVFLLIGSVMIWQVERR
jgi:lipopolysaccharide export system permease protein